MAEGWIRWYQSDKTGMLDHGEMRVKDIPKNLARFERKAAEVMHETGADHVMYGAKVYDSHGRLECVRFYMNPMTDEEYEKTFCVGFSNLVVYALHNHRRGD